jgi:drug/metabolite transporter (DMT)-like permease
MIDVLIMYAFYSLPITLSKAALQYCQPIFLVACRMLLSAPLMLAYVYFFRRDQWKIQRVDWRLFIQVALFSIYIAFICMYWSLQYMSSNKNAIFFTFSPFITAIICYFLYKEQMTWKKVVGLIVGFAGSLPVLLAKQDSESQYGSFSWPEIAIILSVTSFAYGWVLAGKLSKKGYNAMLINGVSMFIGGFAILCTSPFIDTWNPLPFTQFSPFFIYTILMVIFANLIAYNWYVVLLKKYSATFISFVGFSQPLYVAIYSYILIGEKVSWPFFVSMVFITLGLYLFYREELRQKYVEPLI